MDKVGRRSLRRRPIRSFGFSFIEKYPPSLRTINLRSTEAVLPVTKSTIQPSAAGLVQKRFRPGLENRNPRLQPARNNEQPVRASLLRASVLFNFRDVVFGLRHPRGRLWL